MAEAVVRLLNTSTRLPRDSRNTEGSFKGSIRDLLGLGFTRLQYPVIKNYSLNQIWDPTKTKVYSFIEPLKIPLRIPLRNP